MATGDSGARPPLRSRAHALLPASAALAAARSRSARAALSGCGRDRGEARPVIGGRTQGARPRAGPAPAQAAEEWLATKNTQRIPLADTPALGAAVARAVYPGVTRPPRSRSPTPTTGARRSSGAVLMAPPLRAPLLFTREGEIPGDTAPRSTRLRPAGAPAAAGAQAIRLGDGGRPGGGLRTTSIAGADPYTLAANVAEYRARVAAPLQRAVIVVPADDPGYAMPAAAWAAKSGDPVLFTSRTCPARPDARGRCAPTTGRGSTCSARARRSRAASRQLGKLGTVTRITGADAADDRDRLRAVQRRRLRLGRRRSRPRAGVRRTTAARRTRARPRRCRRAAATARCCSSATTAACRARCAATSRTSGPATPATRCAAFTIAPGSSATSDAVRRDAQAADRRAARDRPRQPAQPATMSEAQDPSAGPAPRR